MGTQGNQLLRDIKNIVERSLKQSNSDLQKVADSIATDLCDAYQGQQVYFPKSFASKKVALHRKIQTEFNGSNQIELAHKYQLSTAQIYNILRRIK